MLDSTFYRANIFCKKFQLETFILTHKTPRIQKCVVTPDIPKTFHPVLFKKIFSIHIFCKTNIIQKIKPFLKSRISCNTYISRKTLFTDFRNFKFMDKFIKFRKTFCNKTSVICGLYELLAALSKNLRKKFLSFSPCAALNKRL